MPYLVRHRRLGSYLAEHPVWHAYITRTKSQATRYPTREAADTARREIGAEFKEFFEVVDDD